MPPLLTVNRREWVIKQVIKLEENRELDQDQALKHEDRRELKYQSNLLVKDMETIIRISNQKTAVISL